MRKNCDVNDRYETLCLAPATSNFFLMSSSSCSSDWVRVTSMLFSIVLSSVVDPGIGIMVPNPGFPLYDRTLKILGLAFSLDKNLNL